MRDAKFCKKDRNNVCVLCVFVRENTDLRAEGLGR